MVTARPRALAALVLTVVGLTLALVLGTNAQAATTDAPAPGTPACLLLVNATTAVKSANIDVATATTAKNEATTALLDAKADGVGGVALTVLQGKLNTATQDLGTATTNLQNVVNAQIGALCTGTPVETTTPEPTTTAPTTTAPATTTTATPGAPTVSSVLGLIAGLDCTDFNARLATIQAQSFELAKSGISDADKNKITSALDARVKALGSCTGASTETTVISPTTVSTGSTVVTGGTQVAVPNTSAGVDTGGW